MSTTQIKLSTLIQLLNSLGITIVYDEYPQLKTLPGTAPTEGAIRLEITALNLSARPAKCLGQADVRYVGDLLVMGVRKTSRLKNLGRKSLREIEIALTKVGISWDTHYDLSDYKLWREESTTS